MIELSALSQALSQLALVGTAVAAAAVTPSHMSRPRIVLAD